MGTSEQELMERLRESGDRTGYPELAARLVEALRGGLAELEAVPRDDPFWGGWANERATGTKLAEYARERLERDPADDAARWVLVALALAQGASDGGLPLLAPLIAEDRAVVADAFAIADWVGQEIGLDLTGELRAVCGVHYWVGEGGH